MKEVVKGKYKYLLYRNCVSVLDIDDEYAFEIITENYKQDCNLATPDYYIDEVLALTKDQLFNLALIDEHILFVREIIEVLQNR